MDVPAEVLKSIAFRSVAGQLRELVVHGKADLRSVQFPALEMLTALDSIEFDPETMPHLRELICELPKRKNWLESLAKLCELETLGLSKLQTESLIELGSLRLKALKIHHSNIESLAGVELQQALQELSVMAMPRLRDASQVEHLKDLREVIFRYCPKVESLGFLGSLSSLVSIEILGVPDQASAELIGDSRLV